MNFIFHPPFKRVSHTVKMGLKKAVSSYRKLRLKKAGIPHRKMGLKNGEMVFRLAFPFK